MPLSEFRSGACTRSLALDAVSHRPVRRPNRFCALMFAKLAGTVGSNSPLSAASSASFRSAVRLWFTVLGGSQI
jgi:hypothetical protein